MDSAEDKARKWLASDLAALSDAELDRYLAAQRSESGITHVQVEDPQNLSQSFIQRLRDRADRSPSDVIQSRPVDLDRVNARLLEITARSNSSPSRPLSLSPQPPVSPPIADRSTKSPEPPEVVAAVYYNKLVDLDGRPAYPLHLVHDVVKHPQAYREQLLPWQRFPNVETPSWHVFWDQWDSWTGFRQWQMFNRRTPRYPSRPDRPSAYDMFVCSFCPGSTTYAKGLQNVLALYGFSLSFRVRQDLEQQDKLTTWIEYLAYTCCEHQIYVRRLKKAQPAFDKAWKKVLNAKVLKPSDTREWILDLRSAMQHDRETHEAWQAVESAKTALKSAQVAESRPLDSRHSKLALINNTNAAQSKFDRAKKALDFVERRNRCLTEFSTASREHWEAKNDMELYGIRIEWVSSQIPLIEREMIESGGSETCQNARPRTKRDHNRNSTGTLYRTSLKRQRSTMNYRVPPEILANLRSRRQSSVAALELGHINNYENKHCLVGLYKKFELPPKDSTIEPMDDYPSCYGGANRGVGAR
ncbi:hypothetical protein F5Y01DRAFT_322843 [Xylaria sp. FL0043]|nr:hypothetical protein F5Y01DRAFT_322843 [Xylaria sp. FL0043]